MRIHELLSRTIPPALLALDWAEVIDLAKSGDFDAIAAAFGRRRGLAWCLVRRASISGLEDTDAVMLEGVWRAIVQGFPNEDAFYSSIHSHLLSTVRRTRRRQMDTVSIDALSAMVSDDGCSWDPVGTTATNAVVARQMIAATPPDVVRVASQRLSGESNRVSPADRQRLHRWRAKNSDLLAAAAA